MGSDLQHPTGWGRNSLLLSLPFAHVQFSTLSDRQYTRLRDAYAEFVIDVEQASQITRSITNCVTYRLPVALNISLDALKVDGHYTPQKIRDSGGITLTGIDFKARIGLAQNSQPCFLGVAEELELARAAVVENFLRVIAAHKALEQNGVLLHSAGLIFDNQAYIFCGKSGSGKTTLTRKAFAAGATVLSDDMNLLLPNDKGIYLAHAIPFTGEFGRSLTQKQSKKTYPVRCLVLLEQDDKLEASNITDSQAVARLLTGCPFVNMDASESEKLFDVVTKLVRRMPVVRLKIQRNDQIASILQAVNEKFKSG